MPNRIQDLCANRMARPGVRFKGRNWPDRLPLELASQTISVGWPSTVSTAFSVTPSRAETGAATLVLTDARTVAGLAGHFGAATLALTDSRIVAGERVQVKIVGVAGESATATIIYSGRGSLVGIANETDSARDSSGHRGHIIRIAHEHDWSEHVRHVKTH